MQSLNCFLVPEYGLRVRKKKNTKKKHWFQWLLPMLLCLGGWLLVDLQIHTCPWEWDLRSFSIMADFQFLAEGLFFSMNQQLSITLQPVK